MAVFGARLEAQLGSACGRQRRVVHLAVELALRVPDEHGTADLCPALGEADRRRGEPLMNPRGPDIIELMLVGLILALLAFRFSTL